jgi:hypothetical protein
MIFSFNNPKSQTYRTAQFEAIQLSKAISNGLITNKKIDINNLTKKIYNKGIINNNNVSMMKFPDKPSPSFIMNPSPNLMIKPIQITYPENNDNNSKENHKKILVLYIFHVYNNRVKNFIKNCIFNDDNIDFIIISNNNSNNKILNNISKKNVKILYRDNLGYDFGGWSDALLKNDLYENYDNYIFVNSSVIGPFLQPDFKGKWTDFYINGLQDNVKLFGSTINTIGDPLKWAHVQSYIFSMDKTTLKYLIDCSIFSRTNYAKTFHNAIFDKEVLMSRKIIENNWNIGSLMKYYQNVDFTFRDKNPSEYSIIFLDDVMYPKNRNITWNEYEIIFMKGNRFQIE